MNKFNAKDHLLGFLRHLPSNIGLLPPVLLVLAIIMSISAISSVRTLVNTITTAASTPSGKRIELQKSSLKNTDYMAYLGSMRRLSPVVKFEMIRNGEGLEVSIDSIEHYPEFIFALASMQSYTDAVLWEAAEICIANCDGSSAKAIIKGFKQRFHAS